MNVFYLSSNPTVPEIKISLSQHFWGFYLIHQTCTKYHSSGEETCWILNGSLFGIISILCIYHRAMNALVLINSLYLTDVFLYELRPNNSDEASVSPVSNCPSTECLACARGTKQQNTLRRLNPKVNKSLWLWQRHKFYLPLLHNKNKKWYKNNISL